LTKFEKKPYLFYSHDFKKFTSIINDIALCETGNTIDILFVYKKNTE